MTPSGWALVALAPTIPVIAAVSYLTGRNTGRLAQHEDPIGRLSVFLYQVLNANPVNTPVYLEATRPTEHAYSLDVLNAEVLDTSFLEQEES